MNLYRVTGKVERPIEIRLSGGTISEVKYGRVRYEIEAESPESAIELALEKYRQEHSKGKYFVRDYDWEWAYDEIDPNVRLIHEITEAELMARLPRDIAPDIFTLLEKSK